MAANISTEKLATVKFQGSLLDSRYLQYRPHALEEGHETLKGEDLK